eukprot:4602590-Lingulodinium_polyedra.AAC.1
MLGTIARVRLELLQRGATIYVQGGLADDGVLAGAGPLASAVAVRGLRGVFRASYSIQPRPMPGG